MPREYDELRIRVWSVGHSQYFVLANGPSCAGALIDLDGARDFRADLNDLLREQFRQAPTATDSVEKRLKQIGHDLCAVFFPPAIQDCYSKCLTQGRALRVRFDMPPGLAAIPIEILRTPGGFLALDRGVSIVRSPAVEGASPLRLREAANGKGPLTIVIAGASPRGYDELCVSQEVKEIKKVLTYGVKTNILSLRHIQRATRQSLPETLNSVPGECAVILISHGEYDETAEQGVVILEDENGDADPVSEEVLGGLLTAGRGIRFVALSLCKGARTNPYDPLSGVAGRLIGKGVPMVIAFQFQVSDLAARQFSRALLREIANKSLD